MTILGDVVIATYFLFIYTQNHWQHFATYDTHDLCTRAAMWQSSLGATATACIDVRGYLEDELRRASQTARGKQ